ALAALGLARVVASDLDRARQTAEILAGALGFGPVVVDPGLRERDVGEWTGLYLPDIEAGWPGLLAEYRSGRYVQPPGGEASEALVARVGAALRRITGPPALVVTHGGVIRTLERHFGGTEVLPMPSPFPNLSGRWFEVAGGEVHPGSMVAALERSASTAPAAQ
ncbi:MAG: histidine phosphatase family protein, partial [Acidimicrobiales bacterium]